MADQHVQESGSAWFDRAVDEATCAVCGGLADHVHHRRRKRFRCPECFGTMLAQPDETPPVCGHAIRDQRDGTLLDLRWVEMQPLSRLRRPQRAR